MHTSQRDLVAASLRADELRETHNNVYPIRGRERGVSVAHSPVVDELRPARAVLHGLGVAFGLWAVLIGVAVIVL